MKTKKKKGHCVRSCPFFRSKASEDQQKKKDHHDRRPAVCTETSHNFLWENDLTCFDCLYKAKKDIRPYFGVLGGQIFFGQKGGRMVSLIIQPSLITQWRSRIPRVSKKCQIFIVAYSRYFVESCITSGGARLRGSAPAQHSLEEATHQWRVVVDIEPIWSALKSNSRTDRHVFVVVVVWRGISSKTDGRTNARHVYNHYTNRSVSSELEI